MTIGWRFDNTYSNLPDSFISKISPIPVKSPELTIFNYNLAEELGLRNPEVFAPLWVLDFPLLEWDEDTGRYHAMHHPFTSPKSNQIELLKKDPGSVKANAYDLVINGNEIGGGSIRIHDKNIQQEITTKQVHRHWIMLSIESVKICNCVRKPKSFYLTLIQFKSMHVTDSLLIVLKKCN